MKVFIDDKEVEVATDVRIHYKTKDIFGQDIELQVTATPDGVTHTVIDNDKDDPVVDTQFATVNEIISFVEGD